MKLQVLVNNEWKWVFCKNDRSVITTETKSKALNRDALDYFKKHFANLEFRISK